jgi:transposase
LKSYAKKIERNGIHAIRMFLKEKEYTIVMTKNFKYDPEEPYIYFISDMQDAKKILEAYVQRWKIECCFRHLKTNGFNMEDLNLKADKKIMLMTAVVILTYALAIKEGVLKYIQNQIGTKKYKNGKVYPEMSIFRKGIEVMEFFIRDFFRFVIYLLKQVKVCPDCPILLKISKNVQ